LCMWAHPNASCEYARVCECVCVSMYVCNLTVCYGGVCHTPQSFLLLRHSSSSSERQTHQTVAQLASRIDSHAVRAPTTTTFVALVLDLHTHTRRSIPQSRITRPAFCTLRFSMMPCQLLPCPSTTSFASSLAPTGSAPLGSFAAGVWPDKVTA